MMGRRMVRSLLSLMLRIIVSMERLKTRMRKKMMKSVLKITKGHMVVKEKGTSADRIYVNQSFASMDALLSELWLTACDCGVYQVEKIPCSHAIAAGTAAGLHISTLVWPVYSKDTLFAGYSENIYPCVGQQVEARTCFPPEVKRGAQSAKKLAISVHNVRTDVEDLQVSRPEDLLVSRPKT
ncbi:hypothetical protein F2Q70_00001939 [Brassica cretica]|uniref:SWIM-type domain-containing protein n=1 Tax=Brassica cretica TaxID=69181 RepID=A0A8S9IMX2_BRACR|nr:hypothetical protein F2Q70_00001939 [Brassica cretica]